MTAPPVRSRASLVVAAVLLTAGSASLLGSGTSTAAAPAGGRVYGPPTSAGLAKAAPVGLPPGLLSPAGALLPIDRGPQLLVSLRRQAGPKPLATRPVAGPAPVVGPDATPARVRQVQRLLNAAGAALRVDGDWGRATTQAVRAFQQRVGLPVDGRVGPATAATLRGF